MVIAVAATACAAASAAEAPTVDIEAAGANKITIDGDWLTAGAGAVWVTDGQRGVVTQIDPRTNTVVRRYGPPSGSGAAVVGFGAVWVSAQDISTIWRLPLPSP
jgi:streptogramin lyase